MANQSTVTVDIRGLQMFRKLIQGGPMAGAAFGVGVASLVGVITSTTIPGVGSVVGIWALANAAVGGATLPGEILSLWEARYRAFLWDRFDRFSKGLGDWAPLAASTERRRRKGSGSGNNAILRDTGTLYASLSPNITNVNAGSVVDDILSLGASWKFEVGFGGPAKHPNSQATIADIASFHQAGNSHLPQRQIIVPPPPELVTQMRKDALDILSWYFTKAMFWGGVAAARNKAWSGTKSIAKKIWSATDSKVF